MQRLLAATLCLAALGPAACTCTSTSDHSATPKANTKPADTGVAAPLERNEAKFAERFSKIGEQAMSGDAAARAELDAIGGALEAWRNGIFWHSDLQEAITAAKGAGKPLLSLRVLGRWDEEYC